jgi:endonuclease/exonuclease/phosphatase (EEP) superfamily protein YafD
MRNRDSEAILKAIRTKNPDVVCLVETDQWWERQMRVLEKTHPHCLKCPLENTYGMVLYSRLPFEEARTRFLVQDDVPSMRAVVRMRSGDAVVLYCVHPRPPRPAQASYARDAELVLVGRELHADTRPSIVLGDLNDVGWSYTTTLFQRISHTLDPRAGRGMYNTYNAKIPVLRYPLDHCFHTGRFSLVRLERLGYIGSDHFPMFVELSIEERPQQTNPVPHTTPEDRANADEMIADAADRNKLDSGQSELFFRESE